MYHFLSSHNISYLEYIVIHYVDNKRWLKKNILKIATEWFIGIDTVLYASATVNDMNHNFVLYFKDIYMRPNVQNNTAPRVILDNNTLTIPNDRNTDFQTTENIMLLHSKKEPILKSLTSIGYTHLDESDKEFFYTFSARSREPKRQGLRRAPESIVIENTNFEKEKVGYMPGQIPSYPEADIEYVPITRTFGQEHIDPGPEDWEYKRPESVSKLLSTPPKAALNYNTSNDLNNGIAPTHEFDPNYIGQYATIDSRIYKAGSGEYYRKMMAEILKI